MKKPDSTMIWLLTDDSVQLEATNRVLSSAGWQTRPFTDPDAFLKCARTYSPEVAILDFGGAHFRGLQIRARLREVSPRTRTIIALKAHRNPARPLVSKNELVDLIKQYVQESRKRLFPKRPSSTGREVVLGLSA